MSHYGSSYQPRSDNRYGDRSSFRGGEQGGSRYGGGGGGGGGDKLGAGLRNITWDLSALPVFEKNFYMEHPDVTRRSENEAEEWRRKKNITVFGRGIPKVSHYILKLDCGLRIANNFNTIFLKPVYTFEEASMPEYVLCEVLKQGFKERKLSTP